MLFLNIALLLVMFVVSSWGSGKLLNLYGYPLPTSFNTRQDWILFAMKIILFMILVICQLIILLMLGLNPLELSE